jgi:hypothetical protein
MNNPFKRKPGPYEVERDRLVYFLSTADPTSDEYMKALSRLDQLDKILNRTSELKKTTIPALGAIGGVIGIYGLQQFGGVIIPRALEALNERREARRNPKELE